MSSDSAGFSGGLEEGGGGGGNIAIWQIIISSADDIYFADV